MALWLVGQGGGTLFLIAKMSQDSIDDVLVLNAAVRRIDDDSDRPTAAAANLDVDAEHTFQALSPDHGGVTLGG